MMLNMSFNVFTAWGRPSIALLLPPAPCVFMRLSGRMKTFYPISCGDCSKTARIHHLCTVFLDDKVSPEDVAASPFGDAPPTRHPRIPKPSDLFGDERPNSNGIDLSQDRVRKRLARQNVKPIAASPLTTAKLSKSAARQDMFSPG